MVSNIFLFSLLLGEVIQFGEYFSDGLVQPPTKPIYFSAVYRGPMSLHLYSIGARQAHLLPLFFFWGWQTFVDWKKSENREGSSFLEVENQTEMGTVNHCKVFSVQALGGCKLDAKTRLFRQGSLYTPSVGNQTM